MHFDDSPQDAAFRAEVRCWLAAEAPAFKPGADMSEKQRHDLGRRWLAHKAAAGYTGFTLPTQYGGRGGTILEQIIFQTEEAAHPLPNFNSFVESWGVAVPVIAAHGTAEQFERFGAATLRGDMVWCQMFSEPAAGSDLAAVRTRAERTEGGWILNGQKVWTSDAHLSDWGLMLARTNADVPKHRGVTVFLVDMKSPGIEIRPIRKINGDAEFNEVFLSDVFIPDDLVVGAVDGGWKVVHTTMHCEHGAFSGAPSVIYDIFSPMLDLARRAQGSDGLPAIDDPAIRAVMADYYVAYRAVEFTRYRQYTDLAKGGHLGFENTIAKLVLGRWLQKMGALGMDLAGPGGLDASDPAIAEMQRALLVAPGLRIGGGTDEVSLNNIAERVLGLPGDIRVDKDVPFKALAA